MRILFAAVAAAVLNSPLLAQPSSVLTLQEAFRRAAEVHPRLARYVHLSTAAEAELERAAQRPALTAGAELENVFGTGEFSGLDQSELTLSLASVLEFGDKRDARTAVAQAHKDALVSERDAAQLDLLAEVARRYLDVLHAQEAVGVRQLDIEQRQQSVEAATRRLQAGAAPESVKLSAEASLARAHLNLTRALAEHDAALRRLGALWGDKAPAFTRVSGSPLALPEIASLEQLQAALENNPDLRQFANEQRIREARLQLARSERSTDLEWQLGARRLEQTGDWAAVAAVALPLGTRSRAEPRVRAAQAELASLQLERELEELTLYSTLTEAHAAFTSNRATVIAMRDDLLPRLNRAAGAAGRAYRAGALSYLEWADVQAAVVDTRREQLDAAMGAHRALIEIQRLTGQTFLLREAAGSTGTQP